MNSDYRKLQHKTDRNNNNKSHNFISCLANYPRDMIFPRRFLCPINAEYPYRLRSCECISESFQIHLREVGVCLPGYPNYAKNRLEMRSTCPMEDLSRVYFLLYNSLEKTSQAWKERRYGDTYGTWNGRCYDGSGKSPFG